MKISRSILSPVLCAFMLCAAGLTALGETGNVPEDSRMKEIYPANISTVLAYYYVEEIDDTIARFDSILFDPFSLAVFIKVMKQEAPLTWAGSVMDLGTGTGAIGLTALKMGASKVVGTDIDPLAIQNAGFNAKRLDLKNRYEARLVSMEDPSAFSVINPDERFDLIVADLPQYYGPVAFLAADNPVFYSQQESTAKDKAIYFAMDKSFKLLKSLINGLKDHLKENGRLWISLRDKDGLHIFSELVKTNGLEARLVYAGMEDPDITEDKIYLADPKSGKTAWVAQWLRQVNVFEVTLRK